MKATTTTTSTTRIIGHSGGYRKMFSFGWTCLIYHATTLFCRRNYDYHNDALGKTVGQMVGAARSARQNIVEASSRAATSKEQELRQLDVAKGSLDELAGDYEAFIVESGEAPWSKSDPRYAEVAALQLDSFAETDDVDHAYGLYTLRMRERCAKWLENEDPLVAANAQLIAIRRACALLMGQMQRTADAFTEEGGFTERLSRARIEARDAKAIAEVGEAPKCPKCGRAMRKRVARKGANAGNPFWSCSAWPDCNGTRAW
jgi:restriction system protein